MLNVTEICPVRTALIPADRTDGRTDGWTDGWMDGRMDMTKLRGAFRHYAIAPKNCFLGPKDRFV
jgi:hypothetical protein